MGKSIFHTRKNSHKIEREKMKFHSLLVKFYTLSRDKISFLLLTCLTLFSVCTMKFGKYRWWKAMMAVGVVFFSALIMMITVFRRSYTGVLVVNLVPFHSYYCYFAGQNTEALRTCIMNMILFLPLGLFAGELFPKDYSFWKKVFFIVLPCCLLSITVEALQYLRQCGEVEIDDVINNTFGAFVGMICVPVFSKIGIAVKGKISFVRDSD